MASSITPIAEAIIQDQRTRWRCGDRACVESYLRRHPELDHEPTIILRLVESEILLRVERGEALDQEEYLSRFAYLREPLSQFLSSFKIPAVAGTDDAAEEETFALQCPFCGNAITHGKVGSNERCGKCGRKITAVGETATLEAKPGRMLGYFQLQRIVGKGTFGEVWLARDLVLHRDVAIKLPRESAQDAFAAYRFLREARAAGGIQHPNVVPVYETGEHEGVAYIASAFIRGTNLQDLINRRAISPRKSAELIQSVADAIGAAHAEGILHRDVKPANVLIDAEGKPYVTDFGLAKNLTGQDASLTVEGQMVGTPAYMSPEQVKGGGSKASTASDIYALGVMLYECLTFQRPFRGELESVLFQIRVEDAVPPRRLDPKIPRDLETICLKAMAKRPEDRYASAQHLANDLARFLAGEPIHARPIGLLRGSMRTVARHRVAAVSLSVCALVLLISVASWIFKPPEQTVPRNQPIVGIEQLPTARHRVLIETLPAGATVVCYPLDHYTGRPRVDEVVAASGPTPVQVELQNGMYLVAAVHPDGRWNEVLRSVPQRAYESLDYHKVYRWEYDAARQVGKFPRIRLFPPQLETEALTLVTETPAITLDMTGAGGEIERWTVPEFFVAPNLTTIGEYQRMDDSQILHGDVPSHQVAGRTRWMDAWEYAEEYGMRLLDLVELEAAAAKGYGSPTALEWTATRTTFGPDVDGWPGPQFIVRGAMDKPLPGLTPIPGSRWGSLNKERQLWEVGVRCGRSVRPRLSANDFYRRLE